MDDDLVLEHIGARVDEEKQLYANYLTPRTVSVSRR